MPSAPFPDPEPDNPGPEPAEPVWSGDEEDSAAYLGELMAAAAAGEELTAEDISQAGFAEHGTAEQMHPGPVLATLVHAATTDQKILATLPDDDLIGVIAAVRRIGSFAAWAEMTAIREFATRPDPRRPAPGAAPGATPESAPGATPESASGATPESASGAASGPPPVPPPSPPPVPPPVAAAVPAASMPMIPTRRSRACRAGRRSGSSRPMSWPRTCT